MRKPLQASGFKPPKTQHGRRTISLPAHAVGVLRSHWRQQLEYRMALGLGKPEPTALIFSQPDGSPLSPDNLSRDWRRTCRSLGFPLVMFHALSHTHASALIASGLDVVQISRRLGHGSPVVTCGPTLTCSLARTAPRGRDRERVAHTTGTLILGPGANPVPIFGFRPRRCAKCLPCLDGDVAEWLKAAVC